MSFTRGSKKRQKGATIALLMAMLPLMLIPLVGLGVDGTRLVIVQSKLQSAVDGAGLGAGRLLGTNANTTEIAGEFLKANFPSGYWGTTNFQQNINYTSNLGVQTITVSASADVPLMFIRVLGIPKSSSSASSTVTRRVTRVEMVLDRSGSMNNTDPVTGKNVFTVMQQGAEWFASQFTPGYDELGLVMFSGSAIVAYPETRPWDPSTTGSGGPDKTFATVPATQTGQIFDQLKAMQWGGGTGTPEAMSLAYIELQKAHNRDLLANGNDNTLNTIVLFTDGVPDAVPVYANNPTLSYVKSTSTCTNKTATSSSSTQMKGYIVAAGQPKSKTGANGWNGSLGLWDLFNYDTTSTLTTWVSDQNTAQNAAIVPQTAVAGCAGLGRNGTGNSSLAELTQMPPTDLYGNKTTGLAYAQSELYDGTNTWMPNTTTYNPNDLTSSQGPYNIAAAAWNDTDDIGNTIRSQNSMLPIQIFCIGYSGNGGTDVALLYRLANAPPDKTYNNSNYNNSQPVGKVYLVNDTNQLQAAFTQVASSVLRLAQ